MVQNVDPIFPHIPNVSWTDAILTANTTKDLSSGTVTLAFTAGADGSFVEGITAQALGTNVASVARVFLNNGAATTTATNNTLIGHFSLPATTLSETTDMAAASWPLNRAIPAGYRLYIVIGTTVAAGWEFTVWGGDY
jgi:hypothetical protein